MSPLRRVLPVLICVLSSAPLAADELPLRAVARLGDYRFYHGPGIGCTVLSPDGSRVASAAAYPSYFRHVADKEREAYRQVIVLWDAARGKRVRELRVPHLPIRDLAFSPDGKRLVAACDSSSDWDKPCIVVFEVESGKFLQQFGNFKDWVCQMHFPTDGKELRIREYKGPVTTWDVETGKRLRSWQPPAAPSERAKAREIVTGSVPSPDDKFVAWLLWLPPDYNKMELPPGVFRSFPPAVACPTILIVTDTITGKPVYRKEFKAGCLDTFAFAPDGRRFMTGGDKLTAWETTTGKELFALDTPSLYRFALSPDGRRAVIAGGNSRVQLWDLETRKLLHELLPGLAYVNSSTLRTPQLFSADGKTLLLATDSTLRLFDTTTGKERSAPGHRTAIAPRFSADGRTLFTTCGETRCRWDLSAGTEPVLLSRQPRKAWEGICGDQALAHSDDGRLFVNSKPDGHVHVRETATGRILRDLEGDRWSVCFGVFSPDASRVLLLHFRNGNRFRLYDAKTGQLSGEIKPTDNVGRPVFSLNGRFVAWADRTSAVHLHDAVTGKAVRTLRSSRLLPNIEPHDASLLFSPDGEYLIVTTGQFEVLLKREDLETLPTRVFHIASGKEMIRFYANPEKTNQAAQLSCATCSPDSRLLAVAEKESGMVRLIEINSGKVRTEFKGHRDGVHELAFSPDSKTLASGGEDNVVYLWDVTGARTGPAVKNAGNDDLEKWWTDLAADDAKRAGTAIASMIRIPAESVAFLKDRLHPAEAVSEKQLAQLIADLDADDFKQREAASSELAHLGERAETAMRQALKDGAPPETKRRLKQLLDKLDRLELTALSPNSLRILRAVEALEHIDTPEARHCLDALAKGAAGARQTIAANTALNRLANRR